MGCWVEKGALIVLKAVLEGAISVAQAALELIKRASNAFFEALSAVVGVAQGALDLVRKSLEVVKYHTSP